jgi:hypothetical protein
MAMHPVLTLILIDADYFVNKNNLGNNMIINFV